MDYRQVKGYIGLILIAEVLSLMSYWSNIGSAFFFILIIALTIFSAWKDLRYGVGIAFAELLIGSQGYLFYLSFVEHKISLRIGIFVAVVIVWLIRYWRTIPSVLRSHKTIYSIIGVFGLFLMWGVWNGIRSGYPLEQIFLDVNGYIYWLLLPVVLTACTTFNEVRHALYITGAAIITVTTKSLAVLYLFSHPTWYGPIMEYIYKWIRDTRVGEITFAGGGFWRVFFQSHIFELVLVFSLFLLIAYALDRGVRIRDILRSSRERFLLILIVFSGASVLISFSRSYWLAGIVGLVCVAPYLFIRSRTRAWATISLGISLAISSLLLLFLVAYFPIPKPDSNFGLSLFSDRFGAFTGEAGVSSRWNLLPPLLSRVGEHPWFGSGFGTTVTFQTDDPRIRAESPDGWYTTYTFEWGYLDTVTEIGIAGLLIYLCLLGYIAKQLFRAHRIVDRGVQFLTAGILLGLLVLVLAHATTPYLNHPLGIGYLLFSIMVGAILNSNSALGTRESVLIIEESVT